MKAGVVSGLYVGVFVWILVTSYTEAPTYRFLQSIPLMVCGLLGVAVTVIWRRRQIRRHDWWLPVGVGLLALACYPNTSQDYLHYLFDGEMVRLWHLSPYTHV